MKKLMEMTVRELKELARRKIGRGHSKLKTKKALIAALSKEKRAAAIPAARPRPPPSTREGPSTLRQAQGSGQGRGRGPDELITQEFFLPPRTPAQPAQLDGQMVEHQAMDPLPARYGEDRLALLARDPSTLFAFWDLSAESKRALATGLPHPRAVLRLFDEQKPVREVEFNPELGGLYFHHLMPGRHYWAEVDWVSPNGERKRWAKTARSVELPSEGAEKSGPVQMVKIAWDSPAEPSIRTLSESERGEVQLQFSTQVGKTSATSPLKAW